MIRRSIYIFIFSFITHACMIICFPYLGKATHQFQDNLIKAHHFLYEDITDTILVGTSLSARIIPDSIPSITSLSFSGCSVEDGLRIIKRKRIFPKVLLIEINLLFREPNTYFLTTVTDGPLSILRKYLPSLREQYAPICIISPLFMKSYNSGLENDYLRNEAIRNRILDDYTLNNAEVKDRLYSIVSLINYYVKHGTKILFFEMPMNEKITNLKRYKQTRTILHHTFTSTANIKFIPSDSIPYLTTDGEHLGIEESKKYSHYLKSKLSQI